MDQRADVLQDLVIARRGHIDAILRRQHQARGQARVGSQQDHAVGKSATSVAPRERILAVVIFDDIDDVRLGLRELARQAIRSCARSMVPMVRSSMLANSPSKWSRDGNLARDADAHQLLRIARRGRDTSIGARGNRTAPREVAVGASIEARDAEQVIAEMAIAAVHALIAKRIAQRLAGGILLVAHHRIAGLELGVHVALRRLE